MKAILHAFYENKQDYKNITFRCINVKPFTLLRVTNDPEDEPKNFSNLYVDTDDLYKWKLLGNMNIDSFATNIPQISKALRIKLQLYVDISKLEEKDDVFDLFKFIKNDSQVVAFITGLIEKEINVQTNTRQ